MRVIGYISSVSVGSIASFLLLARGDATGPGTYSYSCDSDAVPDLNDAQQVVLDAAPDPGMHTPDADWAEIARQVPGGWGGFFFDEEGVPTIYQKDPDKSAEAIPALRELGAYDAAHVTAVAVKQGLWDFAQLYDWQRFIMLQDVWSAGIISSELPSPEGEGFSGAR